MNARLIQLAMIAAVLVVGFLAARDGWDSIGPGTSDGNRLSTQNSALSDPPVDTVQNAVATTPSDALAGPADGKDTMAEAAGLEISGTGVWVAESSEWNGSVTGPSVWTLSPGFGFTLYEVFVKWAVTLVSTVGSRTTAQVTTSPIF